MSKKLLAFYSRADENYIDGVIQTLEIGNTEVVAGIIQKLTDVDWFKIEPVKPYAKYYSACTAQAQFDQRQNARPELVAYPEHMDEYDVIYLGYPNYWNTMPMAVFTFLEHVDFSGKTVKPFCTHEGSEMGSSIKDIQAICPTARVEDGLAIRGSNVKQAKHTIETWIGEGL